MEEQRRAEITENLQEPGLYSLEPRHEPRFKKATTVITAVHQIEQKQRTRGGHHQKFVIFGRFILQKKTKFS